MPAYCISNPLYHLAGFLFFLNFKFLRELEREGFMLLQNNCLHLIPCELKPPPNFSHNKCAACRQKRQQTRLNTGLYPGLFLHHCLPFLLHTQIPPASFFPSCCLLLTQHLHSSQPAPQQPDTATCASPVSWWMKDITGCVMCKAESLL